MIELSPLGISW